MSKEQILRRLDDIEYTLQSRLDDIYKMLSSTKQQIPHSEESTAKNETQQLLDSFTRRYLVKHSDYIMSRSAFRSAFLSWVQQSDIKISNMMLDEHLGVAKSVSKIVNKDVYQMLTLQKTSNQKETLSTIAGWKGVALSKELNMPSIVVIRKRKKASFKTSEDLRAILQSSGVDLSDSTLEDPSLLNEVFAQCTDEDRRRYLTECFELFKQSFSGSDNDSIFNTYKSLMTIS